MKFDFIVLPFRGLYLRRSPYIQPDNIVGSLKRGQHFYSIRLIRNPDGLTWAEDKDGYFIVIANGRNPYVYQNGKPYLPLG